MNAQEANRRSVIAEMNYSQIIENELDIVLESVFTGIKNESSKGFKSLFLDNAIMVTHFGPESKKNLNSEIFICMTGQRIVEELNKLGFGARYSHKVTDSNYRQNDHHYCNYHIHWNKV